MAVPSATTILYSMCEHGTVTIELLDENKQVFAVARIPYLNAIKLAESIEQDIARMQGNDDPIGKCVGHG
jgi:hypothetical protein